MITFLSNLTVDDLHKLILSVCTGDNFIGSVLEGRLLTHHMDSYVGIFKHSVAYTMLCSKILSLSPRTFELTHHLEDICLR